MAVEMETLEIKIEASAGGAATALKDLSSALKDVKKSLSGLSGGEKQVEKVGDGAKKAAEGMSEAKTATEQLKDEQDKAASSGHKFKFSLSEITKATGKVQSGISGIFSGIKNGDVSSIFGGIGNLKSVFDGASASGKGIGETAAEGAKKAADEMKAAGDASQAAGDAAGASAGGWQAVAAVLAMDVAKAGLKVWWAFQKLKFNVVTAPFKWMAEQAKGAVEKVTQLFAALKRIAMYRLLRTAIKEIGEGFSTGLENAYYFSSLTGGQLAKSLNLIATEFLYLKNSIGAAVAPLINALAPAVEFVVDKFVALLNVVNQFLSALGIGGKWIKAIKFPTKYGDALDNANSSAKELKRTILGIDEINPLNGDNGSGKGKSGFTAADYSQMFEYETVDSKIGDFAAKIRENIEKGNWAGVGTLLGQKLNTLLDKANSIVDWDNGAGEKITNFLTNITDAFNGFTEEFDGTKAGNLVGNAIQTAFNSIGTLFDKINFDNLAEDFTGLINGALEKIDGEKIGETIRTVAHKLLTTFTTSIKGIDKQKLAEDIAGMFDGLDLPTIFKDLKDAMGSIKEVLDPIIKEALSGLGSAVWEQLKSDIAGLWNKIIGKLKEWAGGSPVTSWLVPLLDKAMIDAGESGGKSLETGLNKNNITGTALGTATKDRVNKAFSAWQTGKDAEKNFGLGLNSGDTGGGSKLGKTLKDTTYNAFSPWHTGQTAEKSFGLGLNSTNTGGGSKLGKTLKDTTYNAFSPWHTGQTAEKSFGLGLNSQDTGGGKKAGTSFKEKLYNAFSPWHTGQDAEKNFGLGLNSKDTGGGSKLGKTLKDTTYNAFSPWHTGQDAEKNFGLGLNSQDTGGATLFGRTIKNAITKAWGPTDSGKSNATSYTNGINNYDPSGKLSDFGISMQDEIFSALDPKAIASTSTTTFNSELNELASGVGGAFGKNVKTNVETGINASGIASNTKTTINNNLPNNTSIGQGFGKKVGENISSGIKTGIKKSPPTISLDLTKFGGGKYVATMQAYATGGIVDFPGQVFIANEAGPELVGNIGRKTAVANTTQMVDAMAQGVYQANAEGNMLMRQLIQYAAEIAAKEYSSGGEVTVESITSAMARNNRRLGKTTVGVY